MRTLSCLLLALSLMVSACAGAPVEPMPPAPTAYRIAAGDKIRIGVFGEERFSGEFSVDADGNIQYPLLGLVAAAGLSAGQLRERLAADLGAKALRNPSVTVELSGVRPVYVLGEVTRPGEFAFVDGLTVYQLVARAGGFTYRANQDRVNIRHAGHPTERTYELTASTPVSPGDTVRIGERVF